MTMTKRLDGRKFDELRPIKAKVGVIKNADGSAYFQIGDTIAYATVYGPRELFPKFLQDPSKGILRCNYNMMPFSGMGERIRPGPSRRSREISLVTKFALSPVLNLKEFPNAVVDVFIECPQADAGSRCAGICAASMALADAGLPMKDLVAAVAIGKCDDKIVVDLDYKEEHYPDYAVEKVDNDSTADLALAMIPSTEEITLMQMDGELSKEDVKEMLKIVKPAMLKIIDIQRQALKEKLSREIAENGDNDE